MKRRLFTILWAVSLLFWLATAALWTESEFASDIAYRADSTGQLSVTWGAGEVSACCINGMSPPQVPLTPEMHFNHENRPVSFGRQAVEGIGWQQRWWDRLGIHFVYRGRAAQWAGKMTLVSIPFWFFLLMFSVLPFIWEAMNFRRRYRSRHCQCPACGYDLRATPERCPECGTIPEKAEAKS